MPRFKPLVDSELTQAQRDAIAELERGPRGKMNRDGPNALMLRSPGLMSRTQKFGEYLRFNSSLPRRLNEFAIIITARQCGAQLEWHEHHGLALQAGIDPAVVEDLKQGRRPQAMKDDEAAVYQFCKELHETHNVSDATFAGVVDRYGEQGAIDLIGLTGYYIMLAMVLNVAQQPLPGGAAPPLPALKQ